MWFINKPPNMLIPIAVKPVTAVAAKVPAVSNAPLPAAPTIPAAPNK